jgi:hypothetical protein
MEIGGASDRDVDRVQWVDDLNVKTLIALIDRLQETQTGEQFIFREAEMDDAYRQADTDLRLAQRASADNATLEHLERVRRIVFDAHDLVGLQKIAEAVQQLNQVVEIKIGLDGDTKEQP